MDGSMCESTKDHEESAVDFRHESKDKEFKDTNTRNNYCYLFKLNEKKIIHK